MAQIMELEELYRRYSARMRRDAFSFLKDAQLAEDVCHDVILRAHQAQSKAEIKNIGGWITTATRNACFDLLRSRKRFVFSEPPEIAESWSMEQEYERLVREELVRKAVGRLPRLHQRLIGLTYFGGRSYSEAAKAEQITEASVRDRLHYARSLLKVELGKLGLPLVAIWMKLRSKRNESADLLKARAVELIAGVVVLSALLPLGPTTDIRRAKNPGAIESQWMAASGVSVGESLSSAPSRQQSVVPAKITPSMKFEAPITHEAPVATGFNLGPVFIDCSDKGARGPVMNTLCSTLPY